MCVYLAAQKIREIFGIGVLELGFLAFRCGKWKMFTFEVVLLPESQFLFVCLFGRSEDYGEFFFGDWNVGARVLGYLDVENGKVYFSEVDMVIWPEKFTSFLCVCLVAKKMR